MINCVTAIDGLSRMRAKSWLWDLATCRSVASLTRTVSLVCLWFIFGYLQFRLCSQWGTGRGTGTALSTLTCIRWAVFEAPPPDWTRLSRLVPEACQLGRMEVFPGQSTLSDPLNTVLLTGPQIIPDAWKDPVSPLPQTVSHRILFLQITNTSLSSLHLMALLLKSHLFLLMLPPL